MDKITKGSHDGAFDWIFEDKKNAVWSVINDAMLRVLVAEHNKIVDELAQLREEFKRLKG